MPISCRKESIKHAQKTDFQYDVVFLQRFKTSSISFKKNTSNGESIKSTHSVDFSIFDQAIALVDIVKSFNWTYISTICSEGSYGNIFLQKDLFRFLILVHTYFCPKIILLLYIASLKFPPNCVTSAMIREKSLLSSSRDFSRRKTICWYILQKYNNA